MILFLDFDGVLHSCDAGDDALFVSVPYLWQILRRRPEIEVVFSTSWKRLHSVDVLTTFVTRGGAEDLRSRFIGATPDRVVEKEAYVAGPVHAREKECQIWIKGNTPGRSWLALDDQASGFASNTGHLYLVDGMTGLTQADVEAIVAF